MNNSVKILLVDDEPDILEFLSYNFRKNGFVVVTANDGEEGVRQAQQELPQLIISDILMPAMDGIEMCLEIRKYSKLNLMHFILLTAVSDHYKVIHAMMSDADQFASKPIRFSFLLTIVNQLLQEKAL